MRKMDYDEFAKLKKEKYFSLRARLGSKRAARNRVRNPEERDALMMMDYQRYKDWLRTGKLIEVSKRKYILK